MKFQIRRTIEINVSAEKIYQLIYELKNWNTWSPWFHCEPTATTKIEGASGVGQFQSWEGEVIGSGRMTLQEAIPNKKLVMKLEFFKPWKSLAEAIFEVKEVKKDQTELTWTMNSNMPIFMIFFKKMMTAYMNNDFDRGLRMLKEFAETGAVISKSKYLGEQNYSEFYVVGKKTKCQIVDIAKYARADFETISEKLKSGQLKQPDTMVTLSHVHDIPKGICEFTAGFGYTSDANLQIPAGYEVFKMSSHKAITVDHYGPYRNIVNPWSMAVSYQRGKKKKILKSVPAYEIYRTMPGQVPDTEIHTQIVMPIK